MQPEKGLDQIDVAEQVGGEMGDGIDPQQAAQRRQGGFVEVQAAVAPAPAARQAPGMRLRRVEDEQSRGRGLMHLAPAAELGSTGLGDGDDQRVVAVRRIGVIGEVGAQAAEARDARIVPVKGPVAGIDAGHGLSRQCAPG